MKAMTYFGCFLIATVLLNFRAIAVEPLALPPGDEFKSVFVGDPAFGRDPFFPKSTRRPLLKPKVEVLEATVQPSLFLENIQLKGISLGVGKKLALLNYYTFAEGEEADLRVGGQVIRIQCLEIKERSVVVSIKGNRTELQLRPGL